MSWQTLAKQAGLGQGRFRRGSFSDQLLSVRGRPVAFGETDSLAEREEFEPSVALERMVNLAKEPYGGYKESSIGREFSLEDMLDSFTQRKNVTAPGLGEITCIRL